jgi:hypothetical protein
MDGGTADFRIAALAAVVAIAIAAAGCGAVAATPLVVCNALDLGVGATVRGTLRVSGEGQAWIEAPAGRHLSVVWPEGIAVRLEPDRGVDKLTAEGGAHRRGPPVNRGRRVPRQERERRFVSSFVGRGSRFGGFGRVPGGMFGNGPCGGRARAVATARVNASAVGLVRLPNQAASTSFMRTVWAARRSFSNFECLAIRLPLLEV